MKNEFVNGFDSWIETYSEISRLIRELIENENPNITKLYEEVGYGLIYELSKKFTNEFEYINKNKEWDGDWFDALENFIESEFNIQ
jgi:hypothetical protein